MRCPKCGFHSFDYLDSCKKCNTDLRPYKASKPTAAFMPLASPPPVSAASAPPAFEPLTPPASPPLAGSQDIFKQTPGPGISPTVPAPAAGAPPPPISFDLDMGTVEETKLSTFPPSSPPPAPTAPSKVPEFTLDFDTPAKPASAPDLLMPPPAGEPLSLLTHPPVPAAAVPGRSLEWQLPSAPSAAQDLLSAPRGGFWIRFAAQVVDGTILTTVLGLIFIILFFALGMDQMLPKPGQSRQQMTQTLGPAMGVMQLIANALALLFSAAYFIYFHGSRGQTPGKMILKLKVIQDNGEEMTYGKSFLRYLGYLISSLPCYLGLIWAAFDKNKQGFHDKIAKTYVVRVG